MISNDRYDNSEKDGRLSWTLLNRLENFYFKCEKNYNKINLRYCGNSVPPPIITNENTKKVVLTFYSDHENYDKGFSLDYDYLILRGINYLKKNKILKQKFKKNVNIIILLMMW